ncbi:DUF5627 domain-containing protein [Sphingobacterium sp. E70]|nr:DUF5627 domain-containing protein [Sphingobacterium sp. E70]
MVGKGANSNLTKDVVRHQAYVEKDEVKNVSTAALNKSVLPLSFKGAGDVNINVNLNLTFKEDNTCSISSASAGISATGSGKFVKRGEKNSWGNADRDALYLAYTIDMAQMSISSKDTLVMRDRAVKMETLRPSKSNSNSIMNNDEKINKTLVILFSFGTVWSSCSKYQALEYAVGKPEKVLAQEDINAYNP